MFLDDELHYHMQGALKKMHELMDNDDAELALEAAKSLFGAILEIKAMQSSEVDIEFELEEEEEPDGQTE